MTLPALIWRDGALIPWQDATVHMMAHAVHYGSSVFEGIRCYATPQGPCVFRLEDHIERLLHSARIYRIPVAFTASELEQACMDVIAANGLQQAYLRPVILRGWSGFAVAPRADAPVHVAVAAVEMGAYLGSEGLTQGVDVCVSSWTRAAPNTYPSMAKAGGNYLNSQLVAMEAQRMGFVEGIALSPDGLLSEGSGENLFLVRKGVLYTPPAAASILMGITRDSVLTLATELGLKVVEQALPRELLYVADEVFMTGTAAEITPVRSVDGMAVGSGSRGPVTHALQERFFGLFSNATEDRWNWLRPVYPGTSAPAPQQAKAHLAAQATCAETV